MSERKYTLREAQEELKRRECLIDGHDWEFIYSYANRLPIMILCGRCKRGTSIKWEDNDNTERKNNK